MNELQRQQYLDALGVDTYMPRWVLPHAPEPVACDVSFVPSELDAPVANDRVVQTPAPAAATNTQAASTPASVLSVLDAAAPSPAAEMQNAVATPAGKPQEAAETSAASPEKKSSEPVPEFALSIWRISDDLLVIDTRQAQLALPTEPLLINILVALGYPRQPLPKTEVIRWPMVDNPFVGQSEADAREMLEAYLDGKLLSAPGKYLLLMGDAAARYVLPAGDVVEQGRSVRLEQHKVDAIIVPSLTDMLQAPERKRITWQAIKPLVSYQLNSSQQSPQQPQG